MKTLRDLKEVATENKEIEITAEEKQKLVANFKNNEMFKDMDDENIFWAIELFFLTLLEDNEIEKMWAEYKEQIKHSSRFFPKSELLNKVKDISEHATTKLEKGTILYRAREYKRTDYINNKEVLAVFEKITNLYPDLDFRIEDFLSESSMGILQLFLETDNDKCDQIADAAREAREKEKPFWGFDKKNCDAPQKRCSKAGRANSQGISYLYATLDEKTAVMEMRPQLGQQYNICKIEVIKEAKLFDFTYVPTDIKEDEYLLSRTLLSISREFSKPNFGDSEEYIPTQYLCEFIKEMGFDGIRFKSSVSEEGINVVLFNTEDGNRVYDIMESRVYCVDHMDVSFFQVLPMELNDDGAS